MKYKFLKSAEVQEILKEYPHTKAEVLAQKHGVPISKIYATANRCGVKKSPEFLASANSGRMQKGNSISPKTQFKKGMVSPRKGKKMIYHSEESKIKSQANRWKKGNIPPNIANDGEVRWREGLGYYFIRISSENWELYNRFLWKQVHGEIPEDHNIIFKDGNRKNCVIENLECLSNAELQIKNSIHRYPSELIVQIKKISKLKRIIKNKSHE